MNGCLSGVVLAVHDDKTGQLWATHGGGWLRRTTSQITWPYRHLNAQEKAPILDVDPRYQKGSNLTQERMHLSH
jgi:hypothetical protein